MTQSSQSSQSSNRGRFQPGHAPTGGRPKGRKNKLTFDIRQAMLEAGHELGADGEGEGGLKGLFKAVGKKKPELLGSWLADLVPRDPRTDDNGHAMGSTVTTINIVGVESGTFLSKAECQASKYGELPLLEHEPARAIDHDDDSSAT